MIGKDVSRSRVFDIEPAERVPGLYNVRLENGEVLYDLPGGVVQQIVDRNGLVPHFVSQSGSGGTAARAKA